MKIRLGVPPEMTGAAARLYWEAFGGKLTRLLGPEPRALAFIQLVMAHDHALCALSPDGRLLGVAGFKTARAAFVGGGLRQMRQIYGTLGAIWRALVLTVLERDVENRRFLMDGLCVAPHARDQGVGRALLEAITAEAARRGYDELRLDVVDTNPRARALYERMGFTPIKTTSIGPLHRIFGFRTVTTMVRTTAAIGRDAP